MEIRPLFLDEINDAYNKRRKNLTVLTGAVHDLFFSPRANNYCSLEQLLQNELEDKFNLVRMDIATGISFYDEKTEQEVVRVVQSPNSVYGNQPPIKNAKGIIESVRHQPLPALVLLKEISDAFIRLGRIEEKLKPLCIVFQYAGSLFPYGSFNALSEIDRQRLIWFMSWVADPIFNESPTLLILINPVKSEVSQTITSLPHTGHIEIKLPDKNERERFSNTFIVKRPEIKLETNVQRFAEDTAGMSLANIKDLLEVASRTGQTLATKQVVKEVNRILQAQLGDIIKIKYPTHTTKDIIGYKETDKIFRYVFKRCENPSTAVNAILVSGSNGAGKTFQLEAHAAESGRVVIELAGLRGSYFGDTDKFWELFLFNVTIFGKVLILLDEAHTAFGSVHGKDTHETEKRLAGNMIKMMGDPLLAGKILWALMSSRPDELDPDIKSRSPIQIPIFDLEGEDRKLFVKMMLERATVVVPDTELEEILKRTDYFSARDYNNFVKEIIGQRIDNPKMSAGEVLSEWNASKSIILQREFQMFIATQHCSYPKLIPERLRQLSDIDILKKIEELKFVLRY